MRMPDAKEPVPIKRQMNVTPSVLREPLTTIDVESARDQKLSDDLNTELAAETNDVNDRDPDLVTGMGGGNDPIVDGVDVETDLEEATPMRSNETDQPPQSDMAPMSGHSRHRDDLRETASRLPREADQDEEAAVTLAENQPNAEPGAESSSE
jgi:hypothetical protein